VDTLSFTCQICSFVIDKPATVFPTANARRMQSTIFPLQTHLDCRNFVCTPALLLAMEGITLEILSSLFSLLDPTCSLWQGRIESPEKYGLDPFVSKPSSTLSRCSDHIVNSSLVDPHLFPSRPLRQGGSAVHVARGPCHSISTLPFLLCILYPLDGAAIASGKREFTYYSNP
jgi:hypothetical protein